MKNKLMELIEENIKKGNKEIKIHTITTTGSGRYTQYTTDKTPKIAAFLEENNIKYTIGNDAKRGGKLGKYVYFKIDKRNKIIKDIVSSIEKEQEEKQEKIAENIKNIEKAKEEIQGNIFSTNEISDFLENYKESQNLYIYRKKKGLNYRQFRNLVKEVYNL